MKTSTTRFKRTPAQLAILSCFALAAPATLASPVVYHDSYTLQTTNQSMWSAGGQSSWSYDSGFQGAKWGTYTGGSAASFGVNAITGSQNTVITPAIPGTPGFHVPSTVVCWAGVCTPELGDYDVPGIPDIPAVTADTRTGASITMSSSGRVGVDVKARADGGAIAVVLPVQTTLQIDNLGNGKFHIGGGNTIGAGASISSTAPSFKAGVDGVINIDNSASATGCIIFAGCSSSSSTLNIDPGQFSMVALDTTATKPFSAFGFGLPQVKYGKEIQIRSGPETPECTASKNSPGQSALIENGLAPDPCAAGPFAAPVVAVLKVDKLNDHSGGSMNGDTLQMSNNDSVLRVTADLTGIAQYALGSPVDVLNPSLDLGVATISGTLIDVQAGIQLGLTQSFGFTPDLLATLTFDRDVVEYQNQKIGETVTEQLDFGCLFAPWAMPYECHGANKVTRTPIYGLVAVNVGKTITVDLEKGIDFAFAGGGTGDLLNRTYSIKDENNFNSNSKISIDPTMPIKAACFDLELKLGLGGTGNHCALDTEFRTTGLLEVSVYQNTFGLQGFNTAAFDEQAHIGVPEPSSIFLIGIGLLGLAYSFRPKVRFQRYQYR